MLAMLNKSITPLCISLAYMSYSNPNHCGGMNLEMPIMWLVMALAHLSPWIKE
jgi:hypothetical protein